MKMHAWMFFVVLAALLFGCSTEQGTDERAEVFLSDSLVLKAENLIGLSFTEEERELMKGGLEYNLRRYAYMRQFELTNDIRPALFFNPLPVGFQLPKEQIAIEWKKWDEPVLPEKESDIAFLPVYKLSALIQSKQISSVDLTRIYLDRLKKYDDSLHCVISLCEDLAMEQARRADAEIADGKYRGPLHGIPYGVKDLMAVPGYKTTWGAMPYKDQELDVMATVVSKLEEAGAVLVAKFSLGALAMGDVWFGEKTRNPWNLKQGSSGSSAGSAAATSAGLIPFALGTETLGSIVSPSTRCGVTGLRPTFGRVSKYGAMALSWSMDKIGPLCRTAEDCALVFDVIRGSDGKDLSVIDAPFNYVQDTKLADLKIAYLKSAFDEDYSGRENDLESLKVLRRAGAKLIPLELNIEEEVPLSAMRIILTAEASAAFDELTRSDMDSLMVRQNRNAWPNTFRQGRFIPAVEYIQANRQRTVLQEKMNRIMQEFDVVVTPSFGGNQLLITNLTGHPCLVMPNGFNEQGAPTSISLLGNLFEEAKILTVARIYQHNTTFDEETPPLFK